MSSRENPKLEPASRSPARVAILAWALFIAALAAFSYRGAISDDFTGGDTVALIETSRIRSLDDLAAVITQPMLPIITKFYRPTANLSYALDDALWGFDARGFHLTDVAIHALVCALIVLVVHRFSQSKLAAVCAGLAFALHPILMETVPTSTRRQDTLAGLFMLLTLLWLPRGPKIRAWSWIPALAAAALAMGAKEGSVILPALVFALELALPGAATPERPRWIQGLRRALPFVALAAVFVGWRSWILGGAGGNEYSWNWTLGSIPALGENACNFVDDLVYPLRVVFHPYLGALDRGIALCAALGFFCLIPAILAASKTADPAAARAGTSRAPLFALLAVTGAILFFPAASLWIRGVIEEAYRNEGWPKLAGMIDSPRKQPVELYVWKAFDLARLAATGALILAASAFALALRRNRSRSTEPLARLMGFAAVWIGLHLVLFLAVQRYHAWNAYVPAIPFCILVGLGFAQGLRAQRTAALAFGGLVLWLGAHSPLLRNFDVWKHNGTFNTMLMSEFVRTVEQAPSKSRLEFYDQPNLNFSWQHHGPEPTSAFTFNPPSMNVWVHSRMPEKQLELDVRTHNPTHWPIAGIRMDSERLENQRIAVRVHVLPAESPRDSPAPPGK